MASRMYSSLFFFFFFFFLFTLIFIARNSEGRDFLVGGNPNAWRIPSPSSQTLNQWAESTRFDVGDSLVWKLEGNKDSVLQVSRADYLSCSISNPIADYKDETSINVKLDQSGPYYFISGANGACEKGEQIAVVVMAERKTTKITKPQHPFFLVSGGPTPAPSPVGFEDGPAVAPASGGARNVVGILVGVLIGLGLVMR